MVRYKEKTKSMPHQRQSRKISVNIPGYGAFWEQGTGKTKFSLDEIGFFFINKEINGVLVVAPNGVHLNWLLDEIPDHLPQEIIDQSHFHCFATIKTPTKWHQRALKELLATPKDKLAWLFINYDGLLTESGKEVGGILLKTRKCYYVLDESHHIKVPSTLRTRKIIKSSKFGVLKRCLTGTPVDKGPFDIYSQIRFLQPDFWAKKDIYKFSVFKQYFGIFDKGYNQKTGMKFDILLAYQNIPILREWLKPITSRYLKEDVLKDLPPKTYSHRYFEMESKQRSLYNQMRDEYEVELDNGDVIDASLAIVRLLRLQQITCGYLPTASERVEPFHHITKKNPRIELLEELTSDLSHPALIWARFQEDVTQIMRMLGRKAGRYDGKVSDKECLKTKQAFQKGDIQFTAFFCPMRCGRSSDCNRLINLKLFE